MKKTTDRSSSMMTRRSGAFGRLLPALLALPLALGCSSGGTGNEQPLAVDAQRVVVSPPRAVTGLSLAVTSVVGGGTVTGTVTLAGTAGTTPVTLSVDPPDLAGVPAVLQVPSGATSGTFTITTGGVSANTTVHVTAQAGGGSATADLVLQPAAAATGAQAVIDDPGCLANTLPRNDDGSTAAVTLPTPVNFFGTTHTFFYINNNGNVTFDRAMATYTPFTITASTPPIIAPFFADVDTRGSGSSPVTYSFGPVQFAGRPAMCVNWVNVGYYSGHYDKLNSFQLLLVDRSDQTPGDFDIVMNYDRIAWETGDASGGVNGFGGTPAGAGYSAGTGRADQFYEFPGSRSAGGFLDSNASTGLTRTSRNTLTLGRHVFEIRNGGSVGTAAIGGTVKDNAGHLLAAAPVQACRVADNHCVYVTLTGAQGQYEANGLAEGDYTVTAFAPAGSSLASATSAPVHLNPGATVRVDLTLTGPTPPPPGVTLTPSRGSHGGLPNVYWHTPLVLTSHGCAGGSSTYAISDRGGTVFASGALAEGPAGTYSATVPPLYPHSGLAHVHLETTCPDGTIETVDFDFYIDPSGLVRTVAGVPIEGAVVTLLRSDSEAGPFEVVPSGSAVMSPMNRDNPTLTDSIGHFGWDVISGFYKVRAQADGCTASNGDAYVETGVLPVPPAVTDLDLRLLCPDTVAPTTTATITGTPNAAGWYKSAPVISLAAVDDAGGSGVAALHYTLSGAQSGSTDVPGATTSVSLTADGVTTLGYYATDNAGNAETAHSLSLSLDATAPTITCSATPVTIGSSTGGLVPVHVTVTSGDAASGVASVLLSALASDVPVGSDDQQGFVVGQPSADGQLRAGPAPRTYTLTYAATDVAGNTATCTATVTVAPAQAADTVAPRCAVARVDGSRRSVDFTVSDAESGLASVRAVSSQSASVSVPAFTSGTTATTTVSAKITGSAGGVALEIADVAGNKVQCAASLLSLSTSTRSASVSGVLGTQTNLTVYNGKPGLRSLELSINGSERELEGLKDGTNRSLDITKNLKSGSGNKVTAKVDSCGKTGSADVLVWSGAASATPAHN